MYIICIYSILYVSPTWKILKQPEKVNLLECHTKHMIDLLDVIPNSQRF